MNPIQAITQMRQVLRRQHKSLSTEETYVHWLRHFIGALSQMPRDLPSEQKVERFLTSLALKRQVAASTQNQAFNAIMYFYKEVLRRPLQEVQALRVKRPAHMRHAPTLDETRALLQAVQARGGYPTRLVTRLLYGCGLRVCEPLNLRVKDLDLQKGTMVIRGAKGGKDRLVLVPASVKPELEHQLGRARATWQQDWESRIPVTLPFQLARKYPGYQFAWHWAWLFPAHEPCRHPRTGQI